MISIYTDASSVTDRHYTFGFLALSQTEFKKYCVKTINFGKITIAELYAMVNAIRYALSQNDTCVIYTDSTYAADTVQKRLKLPPYIKIVWVRSHSAMQNPNKTIDSIVRAYNRLEMQSNG